MKAEITKDKILLLHPESVIEEFALRYWKQEAQGIEENISVRKYSGFDELVKNLTKDNGRK